MRGVVLPPLVLALLIPSAGKAPRQRPVSPGIDLPDDASVTDRLKAAILTADDDALTSLLDAEPAPDLQAETDDESALVKAGELPPGAPRPCRWMTSCCRRMTRPAARWMTRPVPRRMTMPRCA